jgi:uncharacterized protein
VKFRKYGDRYVVRLEKGEEIAETLKRFCVYQNVTAGSLVGIGAARDPTLSFFDMKTGKYKAKTLKGDFEVLSLAGNIATKSGQPVVHLHINVTDKNCKSFGGHLQSATVSVTCEVVISLLKGELTRRLDKKTGLNLLDL